MTSTPAPFRLTQAALPVYLPTLLFTAGESAFIPIVPSIAQNVGADLATAGVVAGMFTVGILLGDIPSGWVISRIGERIAMLWSTLLAVLGGGLALLATSVPVLAVGILLIGLATSTFALARHAFLTTFVPLSHRARALSTLGGMFRAGSVIGPLLASGVLAVTHEPLSVFWLMVLFTAGTGAVLLFMPDPETTFGAATRTLDPGGMAVTSGELEVEQESTGLFATIRRNWGVLLRLGMASALVMALRSGRAVILPLWAVSIGMADSHTALVIGLANAVDFALFFTSGQIMDRWGVLWAAVPSLLVMGSGFVVLAFTHDGALAVFWFTALAFMVAVGNGIGSGILLTLGSNLADRSNPAPFLGAWRFFTDAGAASAPLGIAALTAVASLAVAAGALGALGFVGAGLMLLYVPRYLPRKKSDSPSA
jgi:MFS family permease